MNIVQVWLINLTKDNSVMTYEKNFFSFSF